MSRSTGLRLMPSGLVKQVFVYFPNGAHQEAFQTDSTGIATLLLANDGSNRAFTEIGIPEGHHYLSHHRDNPDMMENVGLPAIFSRRRLTVPSFDTC